MTVREVIDEIEALPPAQQRQVFLHLQEGASNSSSQIKYIDYEEARPVIEKILTEHSELFRKLAQ
jgi:hypothetical protein